MVKAVNSKDKIKKIIVAVLSIILILAAFSTYLPSIQIRAAGSEDRVTLETAFGKFGGDHKIYCIDKGGWAIWGIAAAGDVYECHKPSEAMQELSLKEQEYVFWGMLTLQASLGHKKANDIIAVLNANAQAMGKKCIGRLVTEEDLKGLIYSSTLRSKYPWLETIASNTEEYLELAGLLGGGSTTQSGKNLPAVIVNHISPENAYQVNQTDFTIHFDEGGADADFIQKVPIEFSENNGATFGEAPTGGWLYQKTANSIVFSNPNPHPPKAMIKFAADGTEYEMTGGVFASEQDFLEQSLQVWECVICSGTHAGDRPPANAPDVHQRMVWLDIGRVPVNCYACLASADTQPSAPGQIDSPFQIYRHWEDFTATYNVRLFKYDYETGKPLEGARFVLYERFDDKAQIDMERDGPVHIYAGGEPYASYHTDDPVIWDDFRRVGSAVTDANGCLDKSIEHGYHYDKTFCNGHPAPVFAAVPEPEEDDETGELLNGDAIEAAKAENRQLAQAWVDCRKACKDKAEGAFEGVHFHWIMDDVNQSIIESAAESGGSEGDRPDGGNTAGSSPDSAYERSGCFQDMEDTYNKFISLRYSYAFTEFQARDGYIRHDLHSDDLPIEIITTDSSENGANALFSGEYSSKERLERAAAKPGRLDAWSRRAEKFASAAASEIKKRMIPQHLFRKTKTITQEIITCALEEAEEGTAAYAARDFFDPPVVSSARPRNIVYEASGILPFRFIDEDEALNCEPALPAAPAAPTLPATPAVPLLPATPAVSMLPATPAVPAAPATPSAPTSVIFQWSRPRTSFQNPAFSLSAGVKMRGATGGKSRFSQAYTDALSAACVGRGIDPGPADNFSHCSNQDGEDNAWRIYDHRTEGEFHITKKDLDLEAGETDRYSAYGDTQGDGTLEGAVYGLFAAEQILHPDGKTGVVYKEDNLVAVAAADKNGDTSFLVNTEAPGRTYDYAAGRIVNTEDGWSEQAPGNLFEALKSFDDYTEDGTYERSYQNNENRNGNCWIGRPLLMGDYYVKELCRSEGYELSVGNKKNDLTNRGQNLQEKSPEAAEGYAVITQPLFADEQTGKDGDGAGPNELFFAARSRDTKNQTYDLVLSGLPEETEVYRKETGTKQAEVSVGTGTYEKVLLTNPDGSPKYIRAQKEYQYPKYNPDKSLMTREIPVNYIASGVRQVSVRPLDTQLIKAVLEQAEGSMTEEENKEALTMPFSESDLLFVKGKTENALRRNGKATPRGRRSGGGYGYSSIDEGVFDRGVRQGETDPNGQTGTQPGCPAVHTVYGSPVQNIAVAKQKADGSALTAGDAILSVLNYYDRNPYYSYGGIDEVREDGAVFMFAVYAGVTGNPDNFMVLGSDPESDSIIFHGIKQIPQEPALTPRLVYVPYSNRPSYGAFGTYENYEEKVSGSSVIISAELITDAEPAEDGAMRSKVIQENVYYSPGELVHDNQGKPIQAFEYREIVRTQKQEIAEVRWQRIPSIRQQDGTILVPVDAAYTDGYGAVHTDAGVDQTMEFKAALKKDSILLTEEDAALLGDGFIAGAPMNSASYYRRVKKARAKAYLDFHKIDLAGDNTYMISAKLAYPGQETVTEDAGTREKPALVQERVIRQKVRITKDIKVSPDGTYPGNTNADSGHRDEFIDSFAGSEGGAARALDNFRFKLYLKSNLERLYRNEAGEILWVDRDGRVQDVMDYKKQYPEFSSSASVPKLYTRVLHQTDSLTAGSISNNVWTQAVNAGDCLYSLGEDGLIKEEQNPGYIRLLESSSQAVGEVGEGGCESETSYQYEKFFDAILTANHDKWDAAAPVSTSFKPIAYIRALIFAAEGGQKQYPAVHNNEKTDNRVNTSEAAASNSQVSDAVRQFAISWYLDGEVKKLSEGNGSGESQPAGGSQTSQEEIYDLALQAAIVKAQNYLKPFFAYDLDEIYAVNWDGEADGGADKDKTTLAASAYCPPSEGAGAAEGECCYGISDYLPYGIYVAVEQQPSREDLGDFFNKHYQTDQPKEIILPSLYEAGGNESDPEIFHHEYSYNSVYTPQQLQSRYQIRFNREWADHAGEDLRSCVIQAQNNDGSFEVYPYGLDTGLAGGGLTDAFSYQGFTIAQEETDPYKDLYQSENPACSYKSNQKTGQYYRYGSLSEQTGLSNGVKTITGVLTGTDGQYFAALVPWTVTKPPAGGYDDGDQFSGYARVGFHNTFYRTKLRIEKLDSETGETILHDGALFALYSAEREDERKSGGRVKFYEQDTVIPGSREFLEAMGARDITPMARPMPFWEPVFKGNYYGTVRAGTPICSEAEQVLLADDQGKKTGLFRVLSTTSDTAMGQIYADQNTGYLETPAPLGAGCYVLAEIKAPSGYGKSRPIALEVYSDQVSYYQDGDRDARTAAALYEYGDESQNRQDTARIYVNNTPIRLEISKLKPDEAEAEHELNGRIEGSLTELKAKYGLEQLELAYNASGNYLGYGWKRGFLEALKQRQAAGESIRLLYEDGVFTGKARLTRPLETADDANRYLPGAMMTLYDAVKVSESGDREDYRYRGVRVKRDQSGNVADLYVEKGYAGTQIKYVLEKPAASYTYEDQEDDKGRGTWIGTTVDREDTDILFFDLGGLSVLRTEKGSIFGYDREGNTMQVKNGTSIFALKHGSAYLEILCGDYEKLHYNSQDRVFDQVPEGTEIYHLNSEGGRDSRVDPYTGMAWVPGESTGEVYVWPVKISRDCHGNVLAREKITTSRIASINADTEEEYTVGTYDSASNSLLKKMNPVLDVHGLPVYYQQSGEVYQKGGPVYDRDGDYIRYRYDDKLKAYNDNAYQIGKNKDLFNIGENPEDSNDDLALYRRLGESYLIENTWITGEKYPNDPFSKERTEGQVDVLKRVPAGSYILEERKAPEGYVKTMPAGVTVTETSQLQSVKAVDQPIKVIIDKIDAPAGKDTAQGCSFGPVQGAKLALYRARRVSTHNTAGHPSGYYLEKIEDTPASWTVLDENNEPVPVTAQWRSGSTAVYFEGIPKGDYLLEETDAPSGYVRGLMELEIRETEELQAFTLPNDHIKVEILKYIEEDGDKKPLPNESPAELALYEAVTDENGIVTENGIPVINEERQVDRWFTDDCREYTQVMDTSLYKKKGLTFPAPAHSLSGFTLNYEALLTQNGPIFDTFTWEIERTASRSTGTEEVFLTSKGERITADGAEIHYPEEMSRSDREGFAEGFRKHPDALTVRWPAERKAELVRTWQTDGKETIRQLWRTDEGKQVAVCAVKTLTAEGKPGYVFDYQFNYKELGNPLAPNAVSYDTAEGTHRLDYLPLHEGQRGYYVLAETKTPEGFKAAAPQAVIIEETAQVQLYSLKNEPNFIEVEKVDGTGKAVKDARLSLYRAEEDGSFAPKPERLAASWLSGSDGSYTREEIRAGQAPAGTSPGALKPHRVSPLPYGTYYLAETEVPAGYERMEPVRVTAAAKGDCLIRAVNQVKKGVIRIEKTDAENKDKKLPDAVFEIKNLDTGTYFTLITDENGLAESPPVVTGTTGEGGYFLPYRFRIQEIVPPDTYKLNLSVHDFTFTDQEGEIELSYWYELSDEPTEIFISKTDFNGGGMVKGAHLAIYAAREDGGIYEEDKATLKEWISDGTPHLLKGKLSAGKMYILKELEAPEGYICAEPLLFTISDDGRRIVHVTDNRNQIWFRTADGFVEGVESVTFLGRQAVGTELILTELGENLCEQKEITHYSNGSSQVSRRNIFRRPYAESPLPFLPREPELTNCRVADQEGEIIDSWTVENQIRGGFSHTIYNPEYESGDRIRVISQAGRHGAGLKPGDIVKYEISFKNETSKPQNISIAAELDPQIAYMPANSTAGGIEERGGRKTPDGRKTAGGVITWTIRNVEPGAFGSVIVTAAVSPEAAGEILLKAVKTVKTEKTVTTAVNPVGGEGSLSLVNAISGTAAGQLSETEFTYRLEFKDRGGNPIKGSIPYKGAKEGSVKSGDLLILKGGEAVTFTGLAWGTNYKLLQIAVGKQEGSGGSAEPADSGLQVTGIQTEGVTGEEPVSAIFQNHKNDGAVRERFKMGETYTLTESTKYSDGNEVESEKLTFTLDGNGTVNSLDIINRPTHVILSKTKITGSAELPGAHMILQDETGEVVDEWISENRPHELIGVLKPGKTYTLTEQSPPDGYAFAESITFTVSWDGTVDFVRMEDHMTEVVLSKTDLAGEQELSGAHLSVQDLDGQAVINWISDGSPRRLTGKLNAGQTYRFTELKPPAGYLRAQPVEFTVSEDGTSDRVVMKDPPVRLWIEKHGLSEDGKEDLGLIGGAVIQIRGPEDQVVLEFTTKEGEPEAADGLLCAGVTYRAVEIKAPPGYELAAPVTFTIPMDQEDGQETIVVRMDDRKIPKPRPDRPGSAKEDVPPAVTKKGYITAAYKRRLTGEGKLVVRGGPRPKIPGLGERIDPVWEAAAGVLLLGMAILFLRLGKQKGKKEGETEGETEGKKEGKTEGKTEGKRKGRDKSEL